MIEDLVKKFEALKKKKEELTSSKIQIRTRIEGYKEDLSKLEKEILSEAKVSSVDEAKVLLESNRSKLEKDIKILEEKMKPFSEAVEKEDIEIDDSFEGLEK